MLFLNVHMNILFPNNNECELTQKISNSGASDFIFAYYSLSLAIEKNAAFVLTDVFIDKIGLKKLKSTLRNMSLVLYDGKSSSKYLNYVLKKEIVSVVFGLECGVQKDGYKSPGTLLTPEVVQLLKNHDIRYGFCASDILQELSSRSNILLPRLRLNATLAKKKIVFSGNAFSLSAILAVKSLLFK